MSSVKTFEGILDRSEGLLTASGFDVLLDRFEESLVDFGFAGCVVTAFPSHGASHQHTFVHGSMVDWVTAYESERLFQDCPMTAHGLAESFPATIESVAAAVTPDTRAARVMNIARDLGVTHGLLVPLHRRNGDKAAVGVMTREAIPQPADVKAVHLLSCLFQSRFDELVRVHTEQEASVLTPREVEVLRWLAEGKTSEDVAAILGISAATVMFHCNKAAERLGTLNRTHTITEAMRRRMLSY